MCGCGDSIQKFITSLSVSSLLCHSNALQTLMYFQKSSKFQEMESLATRMSKIASLSKELSSAFGKHRASVSQLAEANRKVKSLQFLLSLPQKLQV